jgi:hypothetical protein
VPPETSEPVQSPPTRPDHQTLELVSRVARVATLESIVLKELRCERADEVLSTEFTASNEATVGFSLREEALFVTVRFIYKTEPIAISVHSTFNVHYTLAEERQPNEAEAFAQMNGLFNVWPYWRELVQNTATRMGVVIPPIPLLKL